MSKKKFLSIATFKFFLAYLGISVIFFWTVVFKGSVLFYGDNFIQNAPNMSFWRQQVLSGQLPLWNPYIFTGIPHLANLATNTLSPFNIMYLIIPDALKALSVLVILLLSLAGYWTFLFLKQHHLGNKAAFLGGVIFAFSGTVLAAVNDINSLQGIVFIPLVLLWAEKLRLSGDTPGNITPGLVLVMGLQFISGHPQYSYYTWLLVAVYLFVFLKHKLLKKIALISTVFCLFLLLSAVQLLPFLELSQLVYRPQSTSFADSNSFQIWDVPKIVHGQFYGAWNQGNSWGPKVLAETGRANSEGFVGVFALLLAGIGVYKSQNRVVKFFLLMSICSLILAFGSATPFYTVLRNFLPLFAKFRSPVRILCLFSFSLAVLSAYGMQKILDSKRFK